MNTNPASPFTVQSGSSATLFIAAATTAATGNAAIAAQGTSGALSHGATLDVTVQTGPNSAATRTTYTRTDSIAELDDITGEPHHRHMSYDPASHRLFVANSHENRVDVLSSLDGSRVVSVDVAGASSADVSADGKTVLVGSMTNKVVTIETGSLQVARIYVLPGVAALPNSLFDRPEEVIALSGGQALVRLKQSGAANALLALWDPSSKSLQNLTSTAPQVFQSGLGAMARSGDRTRVLVTADDASGEAVVLDGAASVAAGPKVITAGNVLYAAANGDGSRFAIAMDVGGVEQVLLMDASLNVLQTRVTVGLRGLAFSPDGSTIYAGEMESGNAVLSALSSSDLHLSGQAQDLNIEGVFTEFEDCDETGMVFGLSNRGVAFVDAAKLGALPAVFPALAAAPAVTPSGGTNGGGTVVTVSGQNFSANPDVRFGSQEASKIGGSTGTQIQTTSPASSTGGAVNVTAYFSSGAIALAPDAFSYGPQILEVLPNAGNSAGGDSVAIYGYGFGEDANKVTVKFGNTTATASAIEDIGAVSSSLGLGVTFPFPVQRITVSAPSVPPGNVDIAVNTPNGSATAKRAFQYLQSTQVFAKAGFYKFLTYDQKRQWIYLSNIDHVDVFDLAAGNFRAGIAPPGGPPPNALIRQSALTPDATQLAIADFGAQSVYLMDPDAGTGTKVFVGGVAGDANSGPVRIASTSAQTIFVGLAGFGTGSGCSTCLQQMSLASSPIVVEAAPQPQVSSLTSAPLLDGSGDGNSAFFAFAGAPGRPMAAWKAATPGQFATALTNVAASDFVAAADGTVIAARSGSTVEIRDQNLALQWVAGGSELEAIPQRTDAPGIALHPSGALLYLPFLTGAAPVTAPFAGLQGGVDIVDAHTGRLRMRVMLPEPLAMLAADLGGLQGKFLAVDENGQRLFALTASGLTVVKLARVPLGIGTVSPTNGPASGGTVLTIRGSGFQNGATATIGGKAVNITFVDMNTLKAILPALLSGAERLTISNPDGETVSLDGAIVVD
ncbi:MAG TPA: IPT/TIG domain-containing protein [Candidatus Acidoferrum sp.]|nr:IPT/TIG domain-containing protein [Candidatus Acidoferrum sp.]